MSPATAAGASTGASGDDAFVSVIPVDEGEAICGVTKKGKLLCCSADDVNFLAAGRGVAFIKVAPGDRSPST